MAKSKVFEKDSSGAVDFNMTPMIDVTFQLIIFFILAGQMASQELAPMQVPRPTKSKAIPEAEAEKQGRIIINVVSRADPDPKAPADPYRDRQAKEFRIGPKTFPMVDKSFEQWLEKNKNNAIARTGQEAKDIQVEIRADKRVSYSHVKSVMKAAADAGFVRMNLTALVKTGD